MPNIITSIAYKSTESQESFKFRYQTFKPSNF